MRAENSCRATDWRIRTRKEAGREDSSDIFDGRDADAVHLAEGRPQPRVGHLALRADLNAHMIKPSRACGSKCSRRVRLPEMQGPRRPNQL
jgi:hypothetical protein